MSKVDTFSPEENAVIRRVLQRVYERSGATNQEELAELLEVNQQSASRLLKDTGFSLRTARRVATLAGYWGIDAMLLAEGALRLGAEEPKDKYPNRALAVRLARALGLDPDAVKAAQSMEGAGLEQRKTSWWVSLMQDSTDDLETERRKTLEASAKVRGRRKRSKDSAA